MPTVKRAFVTLAMFLLVLGTAVRLAPLTSDSRLMAAVSEDGYLMLTVARSVALGRSLTIADGTIATNGVQPLVTFVWAGVHRLYGGERKPSLRTIVILQWVVALAAAGLLASLARECFRGLPAGPAAALFAASLWFASPPALRHTTNGLETGPYVCGMAAILLLDLRWRTRTAVRAGAMGALLGLLFLVRNDAVFFIGTLLAAEVWGGRPAREPHSRSAWQRLGHAAIISATLLLAASPWLAYNARAFGHVVPISGRAQSLNARFAENLVAVPRVLAEYAWMATPLPARLGSDWAAASICIAALAAASLLTVWRARSTGLVLHRWIALLLVSSGLMAVYYGLFFGAAYFLSRYLFPLSLVGALVPSIWMVTNAGRPSAPGFRRDLPVATALAVTLLVSVSAVRLYRRAEVHDHAQVVQWVADHLTRDTWVGAPQSGTLGYFHDRTINLDGMVNPLALAARKRNRLFQYVVHDTPIEYIVDWYGLARWVDRPETVREEEDAGLLGRHFAVLVRDPDRNLVVLRRVTGRE